MEKVKKYLDENMILIGESSCELRKNGHYSVHGHWVYPKEAYDNRENVYKEIAKNPLEYKSQDHISININNETIIVGNMSVDGIWSRYHYLQTYEHIPRGEPDEYGYYRRSTGDEIIKYIDDFYQKIVSKQK